MYFNRTICVLALVSTSLFAAKLAPIGASEVMQEPRPAAMPTRAQQNSLHVLYGSLWRTDAAFVSTVRIKNILVVGPIEINAVIFMADGTPYPLRAVTLPISGVTTININDALVGVPRSVASHVSQFGSIVLSYSYPSPGHVIASVAAIDVPRSLSFIYPVIEPMPMTSDRTEKLLEGLWWKHDPGVNGVVSLTNTTDKETLVKLSADKAGNDGSDGKEFNIAAHATRLIDLKHISRDISNPEITAGGISVKYSGSREGILITGSLANESEGYSANMAFTSRATTAGSLSNLSLAAVGLTVGRPDPALMPGFPADTKFSPYLVMRNTGEHPVEVNLRVNYMVGNVPTNRELHAQRLRPFQAKQFDLVQMLDRAGFDNFDGMINLAISFSARGGDLVIASGSVDQSGSYVFEVDPQRIVTSSGRITGYWSHKDGNDSMFSLWNPGDTQQEIIAAIYFGNGADTYHLPISLAPGASTMIDIGMLVMQKTPDLDGKVIPPSVQEGSASFASAGFDSNTNDGKKQMTVVISSGNFNVADATCGQNCQFCDGYSNFVLNPNTQFCLVGCNVSFIAQATDAYGTVQTVRPDIWASSNTSVITVDPLGNVHGVGPGKTFVNGFINSIITWQGTMCVSDNMTPNCNPMAEQPAALVTVQQTTVTLSPTTVLPGAQSTVTVTSNPPIAGQAVSLSAVAVSNSGGHQHATGRPVGTFASASGTTNASGQFTTQYTASAFGGSETISGTANFSTGTQALTVKVANLVAFGAGSHYQLVGPTASHPADHYGTATANANLVTIANQYATAFPGSVLNYNDQSLPQGGQFDILADWHTPHVEHRLGINCDVGEAGVPAANKATLMTIFTNNGSPNFLHETTPPHWHLRFGAVGNPPGD